MAAAVMVANRVAAATVVSKAAGAAAANSKAAGVEVSSSPPVAAADGEETIPEAKEGGDKTEGDLVSFTITFSDSSDHRSVILAMAGLNLLAQISDRISPYGV